MRHAAFLVPLCVGFALTFICGCGAAGDVCMPRHGLYRFDIIPTPNNGCGLTATSNTVDFDNATIDPNCTDSPSETADMCESFNMRVCQIAGGAAAGGTTATLTASATWKPDGSSGLGSETTTIYVGAGAPCSSTANFTFTRL